MQNAIESRSDMTLVEPSSLQALAVGHSSDLEKPARQRPSWRRSTGQEIRQETDLELRLFSGSTFRLEVTGDVEVVVDDSEDAETDDKQHMMTYHELVGGCGRQFILVPKSSVGTDNNTPTVINQSKYYTVFQKTCDHVFDDKLK